MQRLFYRIRSGSAASATRIAASVVLISSRHRRSTPAPAVRSIAKLYQMAFGARLLAGGAAAKEEQLSLDTPIIEDARWQTQQDIRTKSLHFGVLSRFAQQPARVRSRGTLTTDSLSFGILLIVFLIICTALSYLPVLTLGPMLEHFLFKIRKGCFASTTPIRVSYGNCTEPSCISR